MNKTADAVVIGGGILGASTAHFLAKNGFGKVVLLEKHTFASVGTGSSAAIVRTLYSNPLTIKLALRALIMFENAREALGGSCDFRQIGYLMLVHEEGVSAAQQIIRMQREIGVEVLELTPAEIAEVAPQLDLQDVMSGLLEPRSGYANPVKTTRNLIERAKSWGLTAYENTGATGIIRKGASVEAVETTQGKISTPVIVNAAGPWGRQVGLWAGFNYSLRWSREYDLVLSMPPNFGNLPIITDPKHKFYFRPEGKDQLIAGLGWPKEIEPLDIDNYDPHIDEKSRQRIKQKLFLRLPDARHWEDAGGWASIYDITDDWHPLVGPEPELKGYYPCFGGSGHGFKLGPTIGEALADMICGKTPVINIHDLRPSRFIEGEPFSSIWGGGNRA